MEADGHRGDAGAQFDIGLLYAYGLGVPRDDALAVQWFRKAADQGLAVAQNSLGAMYDQGLGVPRDYALAVQWFRQAAVRGDADAQYYLGNMYGDGRGVPKTTHWRSRVSQAAGQGLAEAQKNLGIMYSQCEGAPLDYAMAVQWYRNAVDQGLADARKNNLGVMYAHCQGIPQDYALAVQWYRKAAGQGLADAQNNLGVLYANGWGVPKDFVLAYMWTNLAGASGNRRKHRRIAPSTRRRCSPHRSRKHNGCRVNGDQFQCGWHPCLLRSCNRFQWRLLLGSRIGVQPRSLEPEPTRRPTTIIAAEITPRSGATDWRWPSAAACPFVRLTSAQASLGE